MDRGLNPTGPFTSGAQKRRLVACSACYKAFTLDGLINHVRQSSTCQQRISELEKHLSPVPNQPSLPFWGQPGVNDSQPSLDDTDSEVGAQLAAAEPSGVSFMRRHIGPDEETDTVDDEVVSDSAALDGSSSLADRDGQVPPSASKLIFGELWDKMWQPAPSLHPAHPLSRRRLKPSLSRAYRLATSR